MPEFMQKYALTPGANRIERSVCVEMPSMAFSDESQVTIRTDVPQKAFYKDLFMNSGAGIGKFTTQPFVDYMGLEYEYFFAPRENFTAADLEKQMLAYGYNGGRVVISHNRNLEDANGLAKMIREKFGDKVPIDIHRTTGLCSYYAEKGGYIIGFEKNGCDRPLPV